MSGLRRGVKGRVAWAAVLAVLVVSITLVSAGIALADKWTDISDAQWQSQYGVTAADAATVAGGFQDGTFHPKESVKRGQFAKMVVDGFGVAYYTPAVQSFPDVLKSNTFFKYVEGGVKAGIISGYSDGTFKPNNTVSRQQANNILGAFLSDEELDQKGVITGSKNTYTSLSSWYAAEGALILAAYKDAAKVAAVHAPGTAYLVFHEVVKGSNGNLTPGSTLTRAQAVALIIRVRDTTFTGGTLPTVTGLNPTAGAATGGNGVIITGTNFTGVSGVKFGGTSAVFTVNGATQITATAPAGVSGTVVDVTVTTTAGTSVATAATKYSYGIPIITQLSPAGGSANGNTTVSITGSGFTGVTGVKFGNVAAKTFTVLSATQITAVSPAGTNGVVVDVTVTTPAGTSAYSANTKYSYGIPTVAKLDPAAGPATGGTTVVITGSGFVDVTGAAGVKFGIVNATSYVVNSTEKITAVAPAGTAGTSVDVVVANNIGQSSTSIIEDKYSYGPPTITKLNPSGGPDTGGTSITITGTGFTGVTTVKFGTVNAKSFIVSSPTTMVAVAPAGTAGTTVEVYVTTPAGTNAATGTANDYSYGAPTVSGVNPAAGAIAGGNTVVITGANFVGLTLPEQVKFGTKNALTYAVNSSTQITATVPSGTAGTTVNVVVTNAAGASATSTASQYSYGVPTVTSLEPAAGPMIGANSVVINGTGFTGVSAVKFGGSSVTFTVNSAIKITATAPAGALDSIVDVTVTTPAGVSIVTTSSKYRYIASPSISSISPQSGIAGAEVVITGDYFVSVAEVKFGTIALSLNQTGTLTTGQYRVDSDTRITAMAPSGIANATTVDVRVRNPVATSPNTPADDFTYGTATITSLNPVAGVVTGGNTVFITGSGFVGVDWVRFYYSGSASGYVDATSFSVNSSGTQITAVVPGYQVGKAVDAIADKTVDVIVHNPTGTSERNAASKYTYGPPVITGIDPAGGAVGGGNSVVITGYGFTGTAGTMSVMFDTTPATITAINTTVADDPSTLGLDESRLECTKITVTAPAKGSMVSPVDVKVTTPAGSDTDFNAYSYGVPTVTGLNPAAGPAGGTNSVVITGSGFLAATTVYFGTNTALSFTVDSDTQITAEAHSGVLNTTVDVTVANGSGGVSLTSDASKYSYGPPTISSLEPNGGSGAGGNTVTINGKCFTGVQGVKFGAVPATNVVVVSPTKITAKAPAGSGFVYVYVTNTVGTNIGDANSAYYYGIPTISSVSPAAGSTSGETVTIIGSNFTGITFASYPNAVQFGGHSATAYTVNAGGTSITATAPAHSAGTVEVTVTTPSGTNSTAGTSNDFAYGVPTISGLSPTGGSQTGGTTVIITGNGFTGVTGATGVRFGTANAISYTVDLPTQITAVAPSGTAGTTVDVRVSNPEGASTPDVNSKYSYGVPTVNSLSPAAGAIGTLVIIEGTNFSGISYATHPHAVKFGGVDAANYVVNDSNHITAQAPNCVADPAYPTVDVTVTTWTTSASTLATKFSYGVPTITNLSPNNGSYSGGTSVVITGSRFTGVTSVTFGGVAATSVTVNSPTQITAVTPAGTNGTTVDVQVTTSPAYFNVNTANDDYHYGVPTITSIDRASSVVGGGTGHTVIIHGANFVTESVVLIDSVLVASSRYTIDSANQITITDVPAHGAGVVSVQVQNGAGINDPDLAACKFTYGAPSIFLLNPSNGPATGGNTVIITGDGFTGVISVLFGSTSASSVVVNSPTQITVMAPPGSGAVTLYVTTYGGTATITYTYNP